ncbi:argininosuccinate lyase [Actinomycetota bacterium]|nr:argininosuccinate lyase [Actinomycetota bacterium]
MVLWGARFSGGPTDAVFALSRSAHFDWRLAPYDIRSSLAHLSVLESSKLVAKQDAAAIRGALKELAVEVSKGSFVAQADDEDVHSALERGLTAKLGAVGGALRAGRSRNDQVTTDLRLFAIDHMLEVAALITLLNTAILNKASEYVNDSAPGFTHIQHAQPVSFGHELAKHAHAFGRDLDRINDWLKRTSVSSLGAGALAGSSLPLDPARTARSLVLILALLTALMPSVIVIMLPKRYSSAQRSVCTYLALVKSGRYGHRQSLRGPRWQTSTQLVHQSCPRRKIQTWQN